MPSILRTARSSALAISVSRPRRRVRTLVFFSKRCDRNALRRRRRPVPVTLMRLAAPLSVFIFGITSSFFGGCDLFADCFAHRFGADTLLGNPSLGAGHLRRLRRRLLV